MKRERIEDLGVINEKLLHLLDQFETDWPEFDSKHSYELLERRIEKDTDALYSLHVYLRNLKTDLWEVWAIAKGEEDDV